MADVNLTATAVKPGAGAQRRRVTFGATITPGMALYFDGAAYQVADCTSAAKDAASAFALSSGSPGQPGIILEGGDLECNNLVAGTVYVLSEAGKICPVADLILGTDYCTVVGAAVSATRLKVGFIVTGYKTP
jgi:hypothetical protein